MAPFAGKVALITGGSRGIGRATAHLLAARGADVAFTYRRQEEAAAEVAEAIRHAATTPFKPLLEVKEHNVDKTFAITVKGFLVAAQEAVPLMEGRRGRIVAVSGIDSLGCLPRHGTLGAAKAAMEVLTRYLAAELAPRGITVNALNPGLVETDSARFYGGDGYEAWKAQVIQATPKGRVGRPEDIAKVIAFLCSEEAEWVCGQTLVADGGLTLTAPSQAE
ncbi:MAG: SDR family NAD(P)-dependent oxidoreductase [Candidatus Methylomirabilales bacterium]